MTHQVLHMVLLISSDCPCGKGNRAATCLLHYHGDDILVHYDGDDRGPPQNILSLRLNMKPTSVDGQINPLDVCKKNQGKYLLNKQETNPLHALLCNANISMFGQIQPMEIEI